MSDNDSGDGILAFLFGGLLGFAAGLLLAPCSGEETRRRLSEWLAENRERTKRFLDEEGEALRSQGERISAAFKAGKKAFEGGGEEGETQA